jgi:hypothetical protein
MAPYHFVKTAPDVKFLRLGYTHTTIFDRVDRKHKLTCQAKVTATMTAAIVLRLEGFGSAGREIVNL